MSTVKVGSKVILLKGEWGMKENGIGLIDVEGTVVSLKPNHNNNHKYCIQHENGKTYTNNKKGTGDTLFTVLNSI